MEELSAIGVRCIPLDLERPDLKSIPDDIDTFFHMAVDWRCGENFERACQVNAWAVGRIVERCPRLQFMGVGSSAAVYNMASRRHEISEQTDTFPTSHYGLSKLLGEAVTRYFSKTRDIPATILRYWYPFTDDPSSTIDYYQGLLRGLMSGEMTFVLPPDDAEDPGYQQPIFIDDIVRITVRSAEFADPSGLVLNVAGGQTLTLREVVETMAEVFDVEPKIETEGPDKAVNLIRGTYDLRRLADTTGLPEVPFRDGLLRLRENM